MIEYVQPVSILALTGVCISLVRMLNGKLKEKVSRNECHSAQDSIKQNINALDKNINRRFDDLKDFIRNGGK